MPLILRRVPDAPGMRGGGGAARQRRPPRPLFIIQVTAALRLILPEAKSQRARGFHPASHEEARRRGIVRGWRGLWRAWSRVAGMRRGRHGRARHPLFRPDRVHGVPCRGAMPNPIQREALLYRAWFLECFNPSTQGLTGRTMWPIVLTWPASPPLMPAKWPLTRTEREASGSPAEIQRGIVRRKLR